MIEKRPPSVVAVAAPPASPHRAGRAGMLRASSSAPPLGCPQWLSGTNRQGKCDSMGTSPWAVNIAGFEVGAVRQKIQTDPLSEAVFSARVMSAIDASHAANAAKNPMKIQIGGKNGIGATINKQAPQRPTATIA